MYRITLSFPLGQPRLVTQDVGYYALSGPNLSKTLRSFVPSSFLSWRHPTYKLTTSGVTLGERGGKTQTV
jgi:hypothetical protein